MTPTTTRKGFFLGLGAAISAALAKAQEIIITPCRPRIAWGQQIPLCNGQCPNPECDYMAPPWMVGIGRASEPIPQPTAFYTNPLDMPHSLVRIVRCPKCSAAYWQDPQKEG